MLNLSKIEQQTILINKKSVNISEQIRLAIALLDNKWSEKDLEIVFDCEEYFVSGNEELLKQVWINLLDNAIKFSPEHGHIEKNQADSQGIKGTVAKSRLQQQNPSCCHRHRRFWMTLISKDIKDNHKTAYQSPTGT